LDFGQFVERKDTERSLGLAMEADEDYILLSRRRAP